VYKIDFSLKVQEIALEYLFILPTSDIKVNSAETTFFSFFNHAPEKNCWTILIFAKRNLRGYTYNKVRLLRMWHCMLATTFAYAQEPDT